jgi:sodium/bile acid cotransporter 7
MLAAARALLSRVGFLAGMLAAVGLATLTPEIGRSGGPLRADVLVDVLVFAVFFLHGVGLSPESLRAGAVRWKVHAFVQTFTFVVFPLLGLALRAAAGGLLPPPLVIGFLFLCFLPSTITSSVAMTALARGNVVAALFNATLSSLLGVVLTPLLVSAAIGASGELSLGRAMTKIGTLLVLPLAIGQLLHPVAGAAFARHRHAVGRFDRGVVLAIVYVSFCDSVRAGLWTRYGAVTLASAAAGAALLLGVVLFLSRRAARLLRFEVEDEIAAVFCGSKKALATGVPMAKALFGSHPGLGLIVLPIMVYHQLQLFVCTALAHRYARRAPERGPAPPGATAATPPR